MTPTTVHAPNSYADSACIEHPELDWFASHPVHKADAVAICRPCLVRDECLTFALEHHEQGVWGATTEAERRVMRAGLAA